jgi:hypothetical protein
MYVFPAMTFPPILDDEAWEKLSDKEQSIYLQWRRAAAPARRHCLLGPDQSEFLISSSDSPTAAAGASP